MVETLKLLRAFSLPSGSPNYDSLNEYKGVFFKSSTLFDKIIVLLRNDSLSDLVQRAPLVIEVCGFLMDLLKIPYLAQLLLDPWQTKKFSNITKVSKGLVDPEAELVENDPPAASLFQATRNTYRQLKTYYELNNQVLHSGDLESIKICQVVINFYESLQILNQERNKLFPNNGFSSYVTNEWASYTEKNRVTFTDKVLRHHKLAKSFLSKPVPVSKQRLNSISKEVAMLTTSLPPGIFIKIAESRMDVMKTLIIGSDGSPYAGGFFIFDIVLPDNYPFEPPKVNFALDGNDNDYYSFNPNLHKGGNVCLSILNTWQGNPSEMWQPKKSTLLSVLISIQAMILGVPLPWYNEPGMESRSSGQIAINHKFLIQAKTIKYAIIEWNLNCCKPDSKENIWKEITQMYWKHHTQEVFLRAKEWAIENPALYNFGPDSVLRNPSNRKPPIKKPKGPGEDLIEMLSISLGISVPSESSTLMNGASGVKRKFLDFMKNPTNHGSYEPSTSGFTEMGLIEIRERLFSLREVKTESNTIELSWVYRGGRSQKDVRAACKEIGISHAATIRDTVFKLETYANSLKLASTK